MLLHVVLLLLVLLPVLFFIFFVGPLSGLRLGRQGRGILSPGNALSGCRVLSGLPSSPAGFGQPFRRSALVGPLACQRWEGSGGAECRIVAVTVGVAVARR